MSRFRTPADLPGLQFWIESDLGLSQTANIVTSWNDQSAQANNLTPVGAPAYVPKVTNGLPGVQVVSGSSQYLTKAATNIIGLGPYAMGIAMRVDAVVGNDTYFANHDLVSGGVSLARTSGSNNYNVSRDNAGGQAAGVITNGVFAIHTWHSALGGYDCYQRNRQNVLLSAPIKTIATPGANGAIMLGARNSGGAFSLFASATFLAAFICNLDPPHGYLEQVADWWKAKYGI